MAMAAPRMSRVRKKGTMQDVTTARADRTRLVVRSALRTSAQTTDARSAAILPCQAARLLAG
jgi:hypothetical protein